MAADIIQSTTQQFLDIHDITNNYVIMKDGTVSVIITVDAMNFGLLAEEEQDAVMYAYAGLLNSLNYPIQVIINSQTKDVTTYLQLLKDQEEETQSETIRRRIRQYREFVGNLIHERNVLDKKFYVVIPADSIELGFSGAKSVLPGQQDKFDITSIERSVLLEKAQNILDPRRDHLIAQFARIGLFSRQLSTQEIIQLFYVRYNPEATEGQGIAESSSYTAPLVEASIQGSLMNADAPQTPNQNQNAQPGQQPAVPQPGQDPQTGQTPQPGVEDQASQSPATQAPATDMGQPGQQPTPQPDAPAAPQQPPAPQEPTPTGMPQQPSAQTPAPQPGQSDTAAAPSVQAGQPMTEQPSTTGETQNMSATSQSDTTGTAATPGTSEIPATATGGSLTGNEPSSVAPSPSATPSTEQQPAITSTPATTPNTEAEAQAALNETVGQLGAVGQQNDTTAANAGNSQVEAPSIEPPDGATETKSSDDSKQKAQSDLPEIPEI